MSRPFLVFGDGPSLPTGLGRIARDICQRIHADSRIGLDLLQVGLMPAVGAPPPEWPFWGFTATDDDWGAESLRQAIEWMHEQHLGLRRAKPIVLTIWDASRLLPWTNVPARVGRWGYFAIDGENVQGTIGGPAGEVISRYDRVLGYGRYGSRVLKGRRQGAVPYLPHGIDLSAFRFRSTQDYESAVATYLGPDAYGKTILGCVATNQPRKDLAVYAGTLAELKRRGHPVFGWLHTDAMVKAWAVPQLATDFNLGLDDWTVTGTNGPLNDDALAALYGACGATVGVGLGEGFGYPGVESLACGTPHVHHTYAGGAELVPRAEWKVPARAWRCDSVYALQRPVLDPVDVANAVERVWKWRAAVGDVARHYCRGAVAHLDWNNLWPRWASWIRQGLS